MYKKTFDFESSKAVILNYFQKDKRNLPSALRGIELFDWDMLMFFLENPHLESLDFYYWDYFEFLDRGNKHTTMDALQKLVSFSSSILVRNKIQELYKKDVKIPMYNRVLLGRTQFNISIAMCYLILTTFEDEETMLSLLDTSFSSRKLEEDETYQEVLCFILFLKRNYQANEIIQIFTPSQDAPNPAHDTTFYNLIKLYDKHSSIIDEYFIKTQADIYSILEEYFRIIEENSPGSLDEYYGEEKIIRTTTKFDVLYTWQYDDEIYEVDYLPKEKNVEEYIPGTPASLEQMFRNCISFKGKRGLLQKLNQTLKNIFQTLTCPLYRLLF
jgi:hypothetical protein